MQWYRKIGGATAETVKREETTGEMAKKFELPSDIGATQGTHEWDEALFTENFDKFETWFKRGDIVREKLANQNGNEWIFSVIQMEYGMAYVTARRDIMAEIFFTSGKPNRRRQGYTFAKNKL